MEHKIHHCGHKSLPLDRILSHMNEVYILIPIFVFNIIFPAMLTSYTMYVSFGGSN
jgi:hypothetical protein